MTFARIRHIAVDIPGRANAMSQYDIAVAGAGPAGSIFALGAARAGYRTVLVERSRFAMPRFGETAPPELRVALGRVGLGHLLQQPFCRDVPQVLSIWGSKQPSVRHHVFSPYGMALHLDRRAFDEALAFAARDAGADLRLGCAARFVALPQRGYAVELSTGERLCCRVAVLATGRSGGGLGLPHRRRYLDDNIAVAARFAAPAPASAPGTVIEAVPGGWFYLAALPTEETVAVFITSAGLVPTQRRARMQWWLESLARTGAVRRALTGCALPEALSVTSARGCHAQSGIGAGWFAIGDARIAPDPLSGQGILWAIEDAASAVELLRSMKWPAFVRAMRAKTVRDVEAYVSERTRIYAREKRFADDAYWRAVAADR
jgi:flavin-dependent dehydrogenase